MKPLTLALLVLTGCGCDCPKVVEPSSLCSEFKNNYWKWSDCMDDAEAHGLTYTGKVVISPLDGEIIHLYNSASRTVKVKP